MSEQSGEILKKFFLSQTELLELRNYQLIKENLQLKLDSITLQEELWISRVSNRVGVDVRGYTIDINAGTCILKDNGESNVSTDAVAK